MEFGFNVAVMREALEDSSRDGARFAAVIDVNQLVDARHRGQMPVAEHAAEYRSGEGDQGGSNCVRVNVSEQEIAQDDGDGLMIRMPGGDIGGPPQRRHQVAGAEPAIRDAERREQLGQAGFSERHWACIPSGRIEVDHRGQFLPAAARLGHGRHSQLDLAEAVRYRIAATGGRHRPRAVADEDDQGRLRRAAAHGAK